MRGLKGQGNVLFATDEAREALDGLLRELVASLNKVHLDPWTVGTLLPPREQSGYQWTYEIEK
jgi:hypothetical protein